MRLSARTVRNTSIPPHQCLQQWIPEGQKVLNRQSGTSPLLVFEISSHRGATCALCCSHTALAAFAFDEAKVNVEPLSFVCSLPGRGCVMLLS